MSKHHTNPIISQCNSPMLSSCICKANFMKLKNLKCSFFWFCFVCTFSAIIACSGMCWMPWQEQTLAKTMLCQTGVTLCRQTPHLIIQHCHQLHPCSIHNCLHRAPMIRHHQQTHTLMWTTVMPRTELHLSPHQTPLMAHAEWGKY